MTMIETLTANQEAELIILDVFNTDEAGKEYCMNILCEQEGVNMSDMTSDEVDNLIIEFEDELHHLYNLYSNGHI